MTVIVGLVIVAVGVDAVTDMSPIRLTPVIAEIEAEFTLSYVTLMDWFAVGVTICEAACAAV